MDINITGRNLDLDDSLKEYIHKRLDKLESHYRRIYKCEVVLEEEKLRKNAEIILYLKRNRIVAKESSPDIYASIDNATEVIKKQLRRLSGKISSRRRRVVFTRIMRPFRGQEGSIVTNGRGNIVRTDNFADKPMLPEEAKLELDILEKDFIMFKNADTGEANVIYKKNDGNYGIIEPNF